MAEFENRSEIKKNTQHPSHYGGEDDPYETIKVLKAWGLDNNAYLWNTCKYISRAGKKQGNSLLQDLIKAKFYLDYYIDILRSYDDLKKPVSKSDDHHLLTRKEKDILDSFYEHCVYTNVSTNRTETGIGSEESVLKPATPPHGTANDQFTMADSTWVAPNGLNRVPEAHL